MGESQSRSRDHTHKWSADLDSPVPWWTGIRNGTRHRALGWQIKPSARIISRANPRTLLWHPCDPTPPSLICIPNAFSTICQRVLLLPQCKNKGWGMGLHGCHRRVRGFSREIILALGLIFQPKARCRVPFRIPVQQGTGESISADILWVWSRERDRNSTI